MPRAEIKAHIPLTLKRRMYRTLKQQDMRFVTWLRMQMERWLDAYEDKPAAGGSPGVVGEPAQQ